MTELENCNHEYQLPVRFHYTFVDITYMHIKFIIYQTHYMNIYVIHTLSRHSLSLLALV